MREPRAHSEEEAATALGVFVQPSRSFHQKKRAPPPVERVESVMTSLAGWLRNHSAAHKRLVHPPFAHLTSPVAAFCASS